LLTLEETIELIIKHRSDFERNDIMTMIQEKRQELGPEVINDESAAMIVARELGVDLYKVKSSARQRIEDITESTKNVNALVGIIDSISPVRLFQKSDGTEGRVASVLLRDETGRIRVVLWDDMTRPIKEDLLTLGSVVQVRGAYVKMGLGDTIELNIGRMGTIQPLENDEIEEVGFDVSATPTSEEMKISNLQDRLFSITVKVKIQRVFNLSTFTKKKDDSEGKVLSMIVADDTGTARLVFWDDRAEEMEDAQANEIIRVTGAYTKLNRDGNEIEIHAGNAAKIDRELKDKIKTVKASAVSSISSTPLGMKNIGDLTTNMWDVDIEGKVATVYDVKTFTKKDGSEGQVRNVVIADQTSKIRVTFWDEDVDKIAKVKEGDVIRIIHGYTKEGFRGGLEFTVGKKAEIVLNPKDSQLKQLDLSGVTFESVSTKASRILIGEIDDETEGKNVEVCGIIVRIGQKDVIYQACPTCNKKLETTEDGYNCKSCGHVTDPEPKMLYKITVDDGSGSITATLFGNIGEKLLGMTTEEAQKLITKSGKENEPLRLVSDKILGRYVAMYGRVKKFRDSLDISVNDFEFANPVQEIKRLKETIQKELSK
jgi:replication factor A1